MKYVGISRPLGIITNIDQWIEVIYGWLFIFGGILTLKEQ